MTYLFDHGEKSERKRLAIMAAGGDPGTIACFESLGVTEGWHCLEVGAGAGSITEWLCGRVGRSGRVVSTDLQTKFLEAIDAPNLEVRQHDIGRDPLEESAFDLVHARKVLEHMPDPDPALEKMAAALRPGGWLVVEDPDLVSLRHVSGIDPEWFDRGHSAFIEALSSAGYDPTLGIRLGDKLRGLGLVDVGLRGAGGESGGGDKPSVLALTLERVRDRILDMGLLSNEEIDRFLRDVRSPDFRAVTAIHFIAWGRRP